MSSPLAKKNKSVSDKFLVGMHHAVSHSVRVGVLSEKFAEKVNALIEQKCIPKEPKILDIGCGDLTLSELVSRKVAGSVWTCVDIYPLPSDKGFDEVKWKRYVQFDGYNLPFDDCTFDVGILSDVLHHVDPDRVCELLCNVLNKCKFVIIKDHFEYGWFSRQILRGMDFLGNYGYGVSIPERYFDGEAFIALCNSAGAEVKVCEVGVDIYRSLPILRWILPKKWHFFAICFKASAQ